MLGSAKYAGVLVIPRWAERNFHHDSARVRHLDSTLRHGVACGVEAQVRILKEDWQ